MMPAAVAPAMTIRGSWLARNTPCARRGEWPRHDPPGDSVAGADDLTGMPVGFELIEQRTGEVRVRDAAAAGGVADERAHGEAVAAGALARDDLRGRCDTGPVQARADQHL